LIIQTNEKKNNQQMAHKTNQQFYLNFTVGTCCYLEKSMTETNGKGTQTCLVTILILKLDID